MARSTFRAMLTVAALLAAAPASAQFQFPNIFDSIFGNPPSRPPTEAPSTAGFIEVDELTLQGEIKRIFSGWMFAASPGLNAVEHSIYAVWLTDCKGAPQPVAEAPAAPPPPAQRTPAQRTQPRPPGQGQTGLPPQQRATQQLPPPLLPR